VRAQHPRSNSCHTLVVAAVKSGRLDAPATCEACGATRESIGWRHKKPAIIYHHYDYERPLDVIPMCWSCHIRTHCGKMPEPRTGRMYPTTLCRKLFEFNDLPGMVAEAIEQLAGGSIIGEGSVSASARRLAFDLGLVRMEGTTRRPRYVRTGTLMHLAFIEKYGVAPASCTS